jgi:hypothetical protein
MGNEFWDMRMMGWALLGLAVIIVGFYAMHRRYGKK